MVGFQYVPTETGLAFHNSSKFLKMIVGPYGSGKSCICAMDVFMTAAAQAPAPDGTRYSRVGVIRSSYPELQSATRKSLLEVLPSECGSIAMTGSPMRGLYVIPLPDGTKIQLELELWSVMTEDDAERLKSANWSFCWINEATGCSPAVYTAVLSRIGRFPSPALGGCSWAGTIMDFNRPPLGSWLDDFIDHPQVNWDVFRQPPAVFRKELTSGEITYEVNEAAENLENLGAFTPEDPPGFTARDKGARFYRNQVETLLKTGRSDIVDNQYAMLAVAIMEGKPVYPDFRRELHVSKTDLTPLPITPIIVGIDQSGIHPAAVVVQEQNNRWCVLDELYMENEGFETFLTAGLIPLLRSKYPSNPVYCVIDPSNQADSWQAITPEARLLEYGIRTVPRVTNSPKVRIQSVDHLLNIHNGGLFITPACDMLIRGFENEYKYRRVRAAGSMGALYTASPDKNEYSHVHDALGYCALFILTGMTQNGERYQKVSEALQKHRQKLMKVV